MSHKDLARIGKQFTFTMQPGGMAHVDLDDQPPVEWVPLPDWDVVMYLPRYYGVGIVRAYDPQTDTITASFYQWGWTAMVTGPKSDFEFVRCVEPGSGFDAFVK